MTSPTQRTLAECRRRGWHAEVVERFNSFTKQRKDFLGVIDIVAIIPPTRIIWDGGPGIIGPAGSCFGGYILGIQACAGSSHSARRAKIAAEPRVKAWLDAGGRLAVWSWSKKGKRGKRKTWQLREEAVSL